MVCEPAPLRLSIVISVVLLSASVVVAMESAVPPVPISKVRTLAVVPPEVSPPTVKVPMAPSTRLILPPPATVTGPCNVPSTAELAPANVAPAEIPTALPAAVLPETISVPELIVVEPV